MRKLLIFTLVLGMASLAQAGYIDVTLTMTSNATVETETQFTVSVAVTGIPGGDQLGQLTDFSVNTTGVSHTDGSITLPVPPFNVTNSTLTPWTGDSLALVTTAYPGTPAITNGATVFTFTVTSGTELGDINYSMSGPDDMWVGTEYNDAYKGYEGEYGTITLVGGSIDVIPEPMTIALLGLGSLFLMRRRK